MAVYFAALLFMYCFAIAAPVVAEFFQFASAGNAGAQEQAQLAEAMRQALNGRLWIAALAAAATLALGIWARVLPGLRPPR